MAEWNNSISSGKYVSVNRSSLPEYASIPASVHSVERNLSCKIWYLLSQFFRTQTHLSLTPSFTTPLSTYWVIAACASLSRAKYSFARASLSKNKDTNFTHSALSKDVSSAFPIKFTLTSGVFEHSPVPNESVSAKSMFNSSHFAAQSDVDPPSFTISPAMTAFCMHGECI